MAESPTTRRRDQQAMSLLIAAGALGLGLSETVASPWKATDPISGAVPEWLWVVASVWAGWVAFRAIGTDRFEFAALSIMLLASALSAHFPEAWGLRSLRGVACIAWGAAQATDAGWPERSRTRAAVAVVGLCAAAAGVTTLLPMPWAVVPLVVGAVAVFVALADLDKAEVQDLNEGTRE